jgi:ATP-dependent DNA helicase RecQ
LTRSGAPTATKKSRAEEVSWEGVDPTLFEALRGWRREIAARKGLPPYTIFNDSTLREISRVRPTTRQGLHLISGVGESKLNEFGEEVLAIVAKISRDLGLSTDNPMAATATTSQPRPVSPNGALAFPYFREGKSIAEIAHLLGRVNSTIVNYLEDFIRFEHPTSIDCWVERNLQERIRTAAQQHGTDRLKPIFLALNQEVPYDAIRIVLTHLNACTQNSPVGVP